MSIHRPNGKKLPIVKADVESVIYHYWWDGGSKEDALAECARFQPAITAEEVAAGYAALDKQFSDPFIVRFFETLSKQLEAKRAPSATQP